MKDKNYISISIDTEKVCDKFLTFIYDKLNNMSIKGIHLNTIETIYNKFITNTTLRDEKLKTFKIRKKMRMLTLVPFIKHSIRRQKKEKASKLERSKTVTICT